MAIPALLNLIPLASLAAILFLVGYKLAKPALFKQMYTLGKSHFVPFMVTILGIVFTDLLMGIGIGMMVAIFFILYNNYKKPFLFPSKKYLEDGIIRLNMLEEVTFINKASIQRTLSQIPDGAKVIIDASRSVNIDHDVLEIIEEFKANAKYRDIDLDLIDLKPVKLKNQVKKIEHILVNNSISNNRKVEPLLN
jgi:MFS superfamily sulfate permease-like transporter